MGIMAQEATGSEGELDAGIKLSSRLTFGFDPLNWRGPEKQGSGVLFRKNPPLRGTPTYGPAHLHQGVEILL